MKRFFSLALSALLLAGCASAPMNSDTATHPTVPVEPATAEAPAANKEPLRLLQGGDEKQYYAQTTVDDAEAMLQYHIVDLDTGKSTIPCDVKDCSHNDAYCPAITTRLPSSTPLVVDEDTLVVLTGGMENSSLILMDRNCQDRRDLLTLNGILPFWNIGHIYTDGDALYFYGSESNSTHLYRVDLSDGTFLSLSGDTSLQSPFFGALGRDFLLTRSDLTYPEPTGDLAADALAHPTGTMTYYLLNVDTGTTRDLLCVSSDTYVLDRLYPYVVDGRFYLIDSTQGTLFRVDSVTGEQHLLTDQLPVTNPDDPAANYQIEANLKDWLVFYSLPLLVNAETGEVRQRADLPENYWNGYGHQPQIFLQLKDRLLVDCRYEAYTRTDIGTDGTPHTTQTEQMYLGLISIDDFLNGVPNYTEVCKGPY